MCFYAHVDELERLETVQFYRRDIDSLRAMGFDVVVASQWRDVPWNADLYFIWWWTWAHQPLIKARLKRAPTIITGALNSYSYLDRPHWQRRLLDIAVKQASMNVMISGQELGFMRELFPGAPFRYIPCSVDPSTYKAFRNSTGRESCLHHCMVGRTKCEPKIHTGNRRRNSASTR